MYRCCYVQLPRLFNQHIVELRPIGDMRRLKEVISSPKCMSEWGGEGLKALSTFLPDKAKCFGWRIYLQVLAFSDLMTETKGQWPNVYKKEKYISKQS